MSKNLSEIVTDVKQYIMDEFAVGTDLIWEDDIIRLYVRQSLSEVSIKSPSVVKEVVKTASNSKMLSLTGIEGILRILRVEYPIGQNPRGYRNYERLDNETIEMKVNSTPSAGTSGTLTGTLTFTEGSQTVTGSGTAFSTELAQNYFIRKSTSTRWYRVYSVESDTSLTLEELSKDNGADSAGLTAYCYNVAIVYCEKHHLLTDDLSTLNPYHEYLLVLGAACKAALSKTRDHINTTPIGGNKTIQDLMNWADKVEARYRNALSEIEELRVTETYPES